MKTSEQINELAAALSKAQGEMKPAEKDCRNPHFGTWYSSLDAIMAACKEPLAKHGISFTQPVEEREGGGYQVSTRLMHSSGQWIESAFPIILDRNNMQALGSAITYGKRYGLSAMTGVSSDEDDDAEAAVKEPQKTQPRPVSGPQTPNHSDKGNFRIISEAQRKRLFAIASSREINEERVKGIIAKYGYESTKDIRWPDYENIVRDVENAPVDLSDGETFDTMK